MNYNFEYYGSDIDETALPILYTMIAVYLAVLVICVLVGLVMYVIRSLSLHTISKRRGIRNAWLSWIPVGQEWVIGSLSDQYKYLTQGKIQSRRKILLGLNLVALVIGVVSAGISVSNSVQMIMGVSYGTMTEEAAIGSALSVMIAMAVALVSCALSIVTYVFRQMSMYDVYKSCKPNNAVVFLVLGILFGVTEPFFLLACRNKDDGMPPRRIGIEESDSPVYPDPVTDFEM